MPLNTYGDDLGPVAGVYEYVYFIAASLLYQLHAGPTCHLLLPSLLIFHLLSRVHCRESRARGLAGGVRKVGGKLEGVKTNL